MSAADKDYLWIAKLYFCLPLPPEWSQTSDTCETEIFKYNEKQSEFHPCIFYIISLLAYRMKADKRDSSEKAEPIKRNKYHFYRAQDNDVENKDRKTNIIKMHLFNEFQKFMKVNSENLQKDQIGFLLRLLNGKKRVFRSNWVKRPPLINNKNEVKSFNLQNILKLKKLNNNFMNCQVPSQSKYQTLLKINAKVSSMSTQNEVKMKAVPKKHIEFKIQPNDENKRLSETQELVNTSARRKFRVYQNNDVEFYRMKSEVNKNKTNRPKSDFNRGDMYHPTLGKTLYFELNSKSNDQLNLMSGLLKIYNQPSAGKNEYLKDSVKINRTGQRLLSFKVKNEQLVK
jgi:hypothetical protein